MTQDISFSTLTAANSTSGGILPHRSNGLALAEGAMLLGGLAALNYSGALPFSAWPAHPFLFVVILLSAQYGIQGGILAALGAISLSHVGGWPARPFDMTYAEYFRLAWADALSWVMAALTVGIVTTHRGRVLQEQTVKLRRAMRAESLIAAQYQVLAQRTHQLERSLAGRADHQLADEDKAGAVVAPIKEMSRRSKAAQQRAGMQY